MENPNAGEWFAEEAFWENFAPVMFDSSRWAEAPSVVDGIGLRSKKVPPARVLDLCCGMGRISVEAAQRGYVVTGVDLSSSYLSLAKDYADDIDIEWVHSDARLFKRPAAFDLAINLYTSFGYFSDPQDDIKLVKNVAESLDKDGVFIIEVLGKEVAVRDFSLGESFERSGFWVETEYEVVDSWDGLKNTWKVSRDGESFKRSFVQRLYSGTELKKLLLENGFSKVELFGDYDGSPYNENARVLISVAS